jgi:hypothetical protein
MDGSIIISTRDLMVVVDRLNTELSKPTRGIDQRVV